MNETPQVQSPDIGEPSTWKCEQIAAALRDDTCFMGGVERSGFNSSLVNANLVHLAFRDDRTTYRRMERIWQDSNDAKAEALTKASLDAHDTPPELLAGLRCLGFIDRPPHPLLIGVFALLCAAAIASWWLYGQPGSVVEGWFK